MTCSRRSGGSTVGSMLLALDTSTAACSVALFGADGALLGRRHDVIGRGHAEQLVPTIEALLDGRRADRILVGCGPGSFTGLRVGIAAAHGLAIGWDAEIAGYNSLALLAAAQRAEGSVTAAVAGGHGEFFLQTFDFAREDAGPVLNLPPIEAARAVGASVLAGPAVEALQAAGASGPAHPGFPDAALVLTLPDAWRNLPPQPLYGRAPDARPREAA